jgi:hypothetical protein
VAVAHGQFGNPEEEKCLQLEAITRELLKGEQTEKIQFML